MRTNENKKEKTSRTMGRVHNRARDDCFHPAINARNIPAFSTRPPALPAFSSAAMPFHTAFRQHDASMPMPAFSALPPRSASSLPLTAVACRSCHARCSHVRMCPTGVVIVGGLADSSAMGSCVHCIQSGVYESEA